MKRKKYLEGIPLEDAVKRWQERLSQEGLKGPLSAETIPLIEACGRVTAGPLAATVSSPFYHSAAMDGYAVRAAETFCASENAPVRLSVGKQAVPVDTGDPLPDGFNAIIMIEEVSEKGEREVSIEIIAPAYPWQHVRTIGEDIVVRELIVPGHHQLRPADISALLAGGYTEIPVFRRPVAAIIPTGNEIVEPGTKLEKGYIIESNSRLIGSLLKEWGGEVVRLPIVRDRVDDIKKAIIVACGVSDMVVINAGSSAGSEDFTAHAISELGEVIVHGVGIKPGKPVILGIVNKKPVLGIPGYPVSAYFTSCLFIKPLCLALQGMKVRAPELVKAFLSRQISSQLGQEEFVRVAVGMVGEKTIATPVSRGAGIIMSLVRADGVFRIPAMSEGFGQGAEVSVELLRSRDEISNTVVCIGSHDNTLDILANTFRKRNPQYSLSSAHVGSLGGLIALKRGEAHLAGTHLLDEETGMYNVPTIKNLFPDRKMLLLNLVYREQGLVVRRGNPKKIKGFQDLTREDVVFVNRQRGSGTRLLADKCLKELKIDSALIQGYGREEYTHMGTASAVLTGIADTGLAIAAAAEALDLDFIPVAKERYDLAIPAEFLKLPMIQALCDIITNDRDFRSAVRELGGYDLSDMGKIVYEA